MTFCTKSLIICSSWSKKDSNWSGLVISILVSVLISFNSIGYFIIAIFASLTSFGILLDTGALSITIPSAKNESSTESPETLWILILSMSDFPSSLILNAALTTKSAKCSFA